MGVPKLRSAANWFFIGNVRRQDSVSIPAVCYAQCNNAALLGQQLGKSPQLCSAGSEFESDVALCRKCIQTWAQGSNIKATNALPAQLTQYLDYCDASDPIASLLAKASSLAASESAVHSSLVSLGYNDTSTTTPARTDSTTTSAQSVVRVTVYPTTTTSDPSSSSAPKRGVIVPGIVVPVVVVLVGVIFGVVFLRRRRARRAVKAEPEDNYEDKAQLHGDDMRHELDAKLLVPAQVDSGEIAELPAREPVGSEMDAEGGAMTTFQVHDTPDAPK